MKARTLTARIFSLLLGVFSCACSATSPGSDNSPTGSDARTTINSADSCQSRPHICEQMQILVEKMHKQEDEILKISTKVYESYLAEDPEYINDIQQYLDESNKAWSSYRDAQCQLEPYINGMSRKEINNIAEQCRLERTEHRISELEGLLTTLKSNQG